MAIPVSRLLMVLSVSCGLASGVLGNEPGAPSTAAATAAKALQPLVVIGASASAGFIMSEPFGGPKTYQYQLSRYLDAALSKPAQPATNLAATPFFLNPDVEGKRQIAQAVELRPGAVVGIDFLFWFCYGGVRTEEDRARRFERGLGLLESLTCPVVVGDIPDASAAVGGMLSAKAMPPLEAIAAANRRLGEWAKGRPDVVVVGLSKFMRSCQEDRGLSVGKLTWADGETRKLLQDDKLHPARHGCAALALVVMEALASNTHLLSESDVRWEIDEIYRKVTATPRATTQSGTVPAAPEAAGP